MKIVRTDLQALKTHSLSPLEILNGERFKGRGAIKRKSVRILGTSNSLAINNATLSAPSRQETRQKIDGTDFEHGASATVIASASCEGRMLGRDTAELATGGTPAAVESATVINSLVAPIAPIPTGLTIVCVREPSLLPLVRNSLTCLALENSTALDLPFPIVNSLLSLYSGNSRRLEQAGVWAVVSLPTTNLVRHDFKVCTSRNAFDWCSEEGRYVLFPLIARADSWVTVEQVIVGQVTPAIAEGLIRIGNAAQQASGRCMLFLVCSEGYEKTGLNQYCDEYIEVAPCEPDLEFDTAFSIDCIGLRDLNHFGIGKKMCSVRFSKGTFNRRYDPYISNSLETRVLWILRGQGKTLEEIGGILKVNKSTVLRRLQGLPAVRHVDVSEGWLSRYLELSPPIWHAADPNLYDKVDHSRIKPSAA